MTLTKEITFNTSLNDGQKKRIKEQVLDKNNKVSACQYAGINVRTFDKAMDGGMLKNTQADQLMKFCDIVEGVTENEA